MAYRRRRHCVQVLGTVPSINLVCYRMARSLPTRPRRVVILLLLLLLILLISLHVVSD